jgi:peptide/nickel transport system substrate-binding protein
VVRRSFRQSIVFLAIGVVAAAGVYAVSIPTRSSLDGVEWNGYAPQRSSRPLPTGGNLVSSIRGEPRTFNRYADQTSAVETITFLLHSRLVRVNRRTMEIEPMLAEGWTASKDNLAYTVRLRRGVKFSDGVPFTSADVVFAFRAIYQKDKTGAYESPIADSMQVAGKPLDLKALDENTVQIRFPSAYGPGLRILDNLPIYPKHLLEQSLNDGTFAAAWGVATPPGKIAGLGPFVLKEYQSGQRLVFDRNPHYWRKDASGRQLPYLDRITIEILADQNAELLRMQSGQLDCIQSEMRPEDYATLKRASAEGKIRLYDLGTGLDADALWFNLRPDAPIPQAHRSWLQHVELRRALAEAIDRTRFANTVFFGAAVPTFGPVSPGNRAWFDPKVPTPKFDRASAARRLASIGLTRKNAEGILLDSTGAPVQFTLLTQKGNTALERGAAALREQVRTIGIAMDVVPLQVGTLGGRLESGDFEAAYFRFLTSDVDPAASMDLWRSSGGFHVWNPRQAQPATEWERHLDDLITRQVATVDPAERKRLFGQVQRVFADEIPILYFAAPRVYVATSTRVLNATPALLRPVVLWSADTLAVQARPGSDR